MKKWLCLMLALTMCLMMGTALAGREVKGRVVKVEELPLYVPILEDWEEQELTEEEKAEGMLQIFGTEDRKQGYFLSAEEREGVTLQQVYEEALARNSEAGAVSFTRYCEGGAPSGDNVFEQEEPLFQGVAFTEAVLKEGIDMSKVKPEELTLDDMTITGYLFLVAGDTVYTFSVPLSNSTQNGWEFLMLLRASIVAM